ncbi:polysaccharide biosynthesis tyrosine autokinase [Raineyella sp.]|nr:polysaccharide biosynthesis tyrosine autokinase [Raineyella sp.]MEA5153983.1 polysaccharide biosynthesis tyrosine autokinase [Raineyella sp.]
MTLLDVIRLTRANAKLLLIAMVAGLALAAGYTALQPTLYTSTSTGVVTAGGAGSIGEAQASSGLATSRASTYAALAGSAGVRDRIAKDIGAQGLGSFSAKAGSIPSVIQFSATATSREAARDQANALARATADEAVAFEKLGNKAEPVVRIVPMTDAGLPGAPSSPNWPRNLAAGLGAGLVLGFLIVFLRHSTDSRVRTTADVEQLTGASAMTVIPVTPELDKSRTGGPGSHSPAAEALRQLRTNLRFVDVDHPPRSIVVTSAQPGDGKSTVAANLGRMLAEAGVPTVVIDADLRRATQHRRFGIDGSVGLTQVLAGDVLVDQALQETDTPGLLLLPAGRIPPNPSELVGSQRMSDLITSLTATQMVIIDTTPMLPVTDAGLLTAAADGALLVMSVGRTQKEQVRHCAKVIAQVDGRLLGSVLNKAPKKGVGSVYYGAGYGGYSSDYYGYVSEDGRKHKRKRGKSGRRVAAEASAAGSTADATPAGLPAVGSRAADSAPADSPLVGSRAADSAPADSPQVGSTMAGSPAVAPLAAPARPVAAPAARDAAPYAPAESYTQAEPYAPAESYAAADSYAPAEPWQQAARAEVPGPAMTDQSFATEQMPGTEALSDRTGWEDQTAAATYGQRGHRADDLSGSPAPRRGI